MLRKKGKKVFVAMSGGVDSSVAAFLLKKAGFEVLGGFIRGYNIDGCQDKEAEDARLVAEKIGIPFYVFDFENEYKKRVVDYLLDGYKNGITPNPDVVCNSQIKFGLFYDKALEMGADFVASGHYVLSKRRFSLVDTESLARDVMHLLVSDIGDLKIYQAKDKNKDQSYFLWEISYQRFQKLIFPLGKLKKPKVRAIARKFDLPTAEKKDSQGICFLGKFNFDEFLKEHIQTKKGIIIDTNGKKVGTHDGVWFYTIGQKHGFTNTAGRSFTVIGKDMDKNHLIVAYDDDKSLYCDQIKISKLNFLNDKFEKDFFKDKKIKVLIRTRYRQPLFEAVINRIDLECLNRDESALLKFKSRKVFPASGQSVVFYKKNGQMLGGGIIT